jgi:hypothetical protein
MERHKCEGELPESAYGSAIDWCREDEQGRLWAENDEYSSQVNYCPYCGFKARVPALPGE